MDASFPSMMKVNKRTWWSSSSSSTVLLAQQQQQQEQQLDDKSTSRKDFLNTLVQTSIGSSMMVGVGLLSSSSLLSPQVAMAATTTTDEGNNDATTTTTTLPNGVTYRNVKSGTGAKPTTGELAAIRFAAYCNDFKIDDIFDMPEPYYTRIGSGGLIQGVEQTLPLMKTGDRWVLTVPVRVLLVVCFCCFVFCFVFSKYFFPRSLGDFVWGCLGVFSLCGWVCLCVLWVCFLLFCLYTHTICISFS